jgi:hypothetical protein
MAFVSWVISRAAELAVILLVVTTLGRFTLHHRAQPERI